ncbi:hypothetical protein N288_16555 [Bacillus infantis NRRL B-14911]|uniref:Uncharacterized protein n=1 Tax=Bacillus infantis NRRL B-14911 TaxID=1367477 RepID=U5LBJ9_9BACI|nr:hypothetical protein N288_16555 [Bacillus infantis NRRL B-14911]
MSFSALFLINYKTAGCILNKVQPAEKQRKR